MRRVVITGLGMVSPLANGVEASWERLISAQSGARLIQGFETSDLPCKIAMQVPRGDGSNATFNPDQWMDPKDQRKVDDYIIYGVAAATQALADAGWKPKTEEERERTGVLIGSGIGGLGGIAETAITLHEKGPRRVSPFFISGRLINLVSGYVSIMHGLKGPNHAVVTACSTGAHAIGDAARMIALEDADVMVAGGGRIGDQPYRHRRLFCLQGALDQFQRPAEAGVTALRQGSRRFRHGGTAPDASCSNLMRAQRRAARKSMPKLSVTVFRATPITSPRLTRPATALSARCAGP